MPYPVLRNIDPTLTSERRVKVPPGTQWGTMLRLRGEGIRSSHGRGDELVQINVRIPEKLTPKERKLMEELSKEFKVEEPQWRHNAHANLHFMVKQITSARIFTVIRLWLRCSCALTGSLVEVLTGFHKKQLFPIQPLAEGKRVHWDARAKGKHKY